MAARDKSVKRLVAVADARGCVVVGGVSLTSTELRSIDTEQTSSLEGGGGGSSSTRAGVGVVGG